MSFSFGSYDIGKILSGYILNFHNQQKLDRVYGRIGEIWQYGVYEQFESSGAYFGGLGDNPGAPWVELHPMTIAQREKLGFTGKMMMRGVSKQGYKTEKLRDSFFYNITANGLELGFRASYAIKHQLGLGTPIRALLPQEGYIPEEMLRMMREAYISLFH
jgi:hypothetical protein